MSTERIFSATEEVTVWAMDFYPDDRSPHQTLGVCMDVTQALGLVNRAGGHIGDWTYEDGTFRTEGDGGLWLVSPHVVGRLTVPVPPEAEE